jgi:hypothetical protein
MWRDSAGLHGTLSLTSGALTRGLAGHGRGADGDWSCTLPAAEYPQVTGQMAVN